MRETGRSMVETLGVLAIVGVLSIAAVAGMTIARDKMKANQIIADSKLAFMESKTNAQLLATDWTEVRFKPESGKQTFTRRDLVERDFVKVNAIEKGVCKQLLSMRAEGVLNFYDEENVELWTCKDDNNIVIDWNDQGPPAVCLKFDDCIKMYPEFEGICNTQYQCAECGDLTMPNNDKSACVCNPEKAISCEADGQSWCCGEDKDGNATICGTKYDDCLPSDGTCSFELGVTNANDIQMYKADCYYVLGKTEVITLIDTDGTERSKGILPTMTAGRKQCGENEYCALFWESNDTVGEWSEKPTDLTKDRTGILWGLCQSKDTYTSEWITQLSAQHAPAMTPIVGCPVNRYCYVAWRNQTCVDLTPADTGIISGVCKEQHKIAEECPYTNINEEEKK